MVVIIVFFFILVLQNWDWFCFFLLIPFLIFRTNKLSKSKSNYDWGEGSNQKKKSLLRKIVNGFLRYMSIKIGYIPSHNLRLVLYKNCFGIRCEKKVVIYYGCEIRGGDKLFIGKGSIIGDKALLDARNGLYIGANVNLSSNVSIYTEQHDHRDKNFLCNSNSSFGITIGDRAWLGPNSIVLPGCHIGQGSVVAAGAVVTKNVPDFSIVAGIPAKVIGKRNRDICYNFDGEHSFFL